MCMKDISIKDAETIAQTHLGIETLKPRGRDGLDFHDCSVGGIYDIINAAYKAGQKVRMKKMPVKKAGTPWKTGIWA